MGWWHPARLSCGRRGASPPSPLWCFLLGGGVFPPVLGGGRLAADSPSHRRFRVALTISAHFDEAECCVLCLMHQLKATLHEQVGEVALGAMPQLVRDDRGPTC